jgi:hypothetical protein
MGLASIAIKMCDASYDDTWHSAFANQNTSILIHLSLTSFLPQLCHLRYRNDSTDISLIYILLNLIVATEELTLGYHFIVADYKTPYGDGITHDPPTLEDWLNVDQFLVVWLGHLILSVGRYISSTSNDATPTIYGG